MPIDPPFFEAHDAPLAHVFSGTYFQTIDKFFRISLPKEIRSVSRNPNPTFILWKSSHVNAIEATTEELFLHTRHKDQTADLTDDEKIRQTAAIYANVYKILANDIRVTIPPPLRIDLRFERKIVIVGMGAFFHIWPLQEYERFYRRSLRDQLLDDDRRSG
jgi:DNA-binding transcriptional regulator/RsmH inhibitor MraZ